MKRLGDYIRPVDVRNRDLKVTRLVGLTIDKAFIPSVANTIGTDLSNYKVISENQFACSLMQVSRDGKMPIAMFKGEPCIMSPAYPMFEVSKTNELLPEYLMMWFSRSEFDREASFYAVGGVRGSLEWNDFCDMQIPVPAIEKQREIVAEYNTLATRIETNKKLIATLEQTAQTLYRHTFVDNIDPNNLPQGWRMGTIADMSEVVVAGTIPKYDEKSDKLVLGQRCVHHHTIDLSFVKKHIPKENCLYLKRGDILINSTGDGTLGRAGQVLFDPHDLAFDSNMTLVRPAKEIYFEYLSNLIYNKEDYFVRISQGSTNQTRLYCSMVRPVEIIVPTDEALAMFSSQVKNCITLREYKKTENQTLTQMQTLLLSKTGV